MKCEHITSLGKYQFFFSYLFIHWHLYLLSTSLLNVNIATYYTNSLSYGYNLQFSPVKFVISGFEFGNVTIRHWLLWDRWHSCPNNLIVRSRCAKMSIENIPESIETCKLLHILQIIFTMLFSNILKLIIQVCTYVFSALWENLRAPFLYIQTYCSFYRKLKITKRYFTCIAGFS